MSDTDFRTTEHLEAATVEARIVPVPVADVEALPWDALHNRAGQVPWPALEQLAEAVAARPELWRRLEAVYREFLAAPYEVDSCESVYVCAVLALAGPRLPRETLGQIGALLTKGMLEAGESDDDLVLDAWLDAAKHLGPAILPAVLDFMERHNPPCEAWFHLTELTELACASDDANLRQRTIHVCRSVLERCLAGTMGLSCGMNASWTLAYMGDRSSLKLLEQVYAKARDGGLGVWGGERDFHEALALLRGDRTEAPGPDSRRPVREWVERGHKWLSEWFVERRNTRDSGVIDVDPDLDDFGPEDDPVVETDDAVLEEFILSRLLKRLDLAPEEPQNRFADDLGHLPPPCYRMEPRPARNGPCPCGSGKKYKKCCGRND